MAKDRTIKPIKASLEELTKAVVSPIEKEDMQQELEFPLIKHIEEGEIIYQRIQDGYVNATAMCRACNRVFNNWYRLPATKAFLEELSSETRIRVSGLVHVIKGGVPNLQGTWVHPQVAMNLGQWASPKFAVAVSKWVFDWLSGKTPKSELPYHLKRYMLNMRRIPADHFSVLQEMTLVLIAPLEQQGYTLPSNMVPDISQGLIFAQWLRDQGVNTDEMPTYWHKYEDGREVEAKMYPAKYLHAFREHVAKIWMPERSTKYFTKRDKKALPYLNKILQLNAPVKPKTIKNK